MSDNIVRSIRDRAATMLVDITWVQWSALTAAAVPVEQRRAWTIVDPEALVLASLMAGELERRLHDMVASWARRASSLLSMQRMRTLSKWFPAPVNERLSIFAAAAIEAGDRRWERNFRGARHDYIPRVKELGPLRLIEGPSLVLRLRAGFGVNAKADVLSFLLGLDRAAANVKVIAAATAYTERAIRDATEEMTLGGFIHEIDGRPSSYYAEPRAWAQVLEIYRLDAPEPVPGVPPWHFWSATLAFLAHVLDWAHTAQHSEWTSYVAGSRARDLVETHAGRLRQAKVELPLGLENAGPEYLPMLELIVRQVETWAEVALYGRKVR